jgi:hypothetical protein
MDKMQNIPNEGNHETLAGQNFQGLKNEVKWSPLKIALVTLILGGSYAVLLSIAIPVAIGAFAGLLYYFNKHIF